MKVAFAGLGAMGRGMAANLIAAGHELTGFDISEKALAWLQSQGGKPAASVAEACKDAEALVIMVINAEQAEAVLFGPGGAAEGLPSGALVVSGVTMPAASAVDFGKRGGEKGWRFLDAPVSGGTVGAEAGSLTIMAAGSDAAFEGAQPLLQAMGKRIYRLGDEPGPGSNMKMVHQLAAGANLAVAAEVMSFGTDLGLEPELLLEVLNNSAGQSWMIGNRGPRMIAPPESASSAVDIFVKDLGIVLDAARAERFPVPMTAAALQVFLGAASAGYARDDDSQATRFYESLGGKPVSGKKGR